MPLLPFTMLSPIAAPVPLVVDSPHSGRIYPADFAYTCPLPLLRQTEDFAVDELVAGAVQSGATVIMAEFPRCYIDANRAEDDIDPAMLDAPWPEPLSLTERSRMGIGLIRRLCRGSIPVYSAPLSVAEIENRLNRFHRPYHTALKTALDAHHRRFGAAFLINAHSMPAQSERNDRRHPDFILGDRDGTTCAPWLTDFVKTTLQDMGYTVWLNDPFKGAEIVIRYGQPSLCRHALQLEINRGLYMNEAKIEKNSSFNQLQSDLGVFFRHLATRIGQESTAAPEQQAAE